MSRDILPDLLQECLAAYDAGLSPEECLSAFPTHRAELEPLLRQALSVRMAFAVAADETFVESARERLQFAAGREVKAAFSAQPDPAYVMRTRNRLVHAAGKSVQEALRDVPPPRLPFWWNTRRRLMEQAEMGPQPANRGFAPAMVMRAGLSAAVVVLAIALGGIAFFTNSATPGTPSAAAEVASLERDLQNLEAKASAGQTVSKDEVIELQKRTSILVDKLQEQPTTTAATKLPSLIERQTGVVEKVYAQATVPQEVREKQVQLDQERVRLLSLAQASPVASPVNPDTTSASASATGATSPTTTAAPTSTPVPVNTPVLPPLSGNQARVNILADGRAEVITANVTFTAPRGWSVDGISADASGTGRVLSNWVSTSGSGASGSGASGSGASGSGALVAINVATGQIDALIASQQVTLRGPGAAGQFIGLAELVSVSAPVSSELPLILRQFMETFRYNGVASTPPPPPPATSTAVPPTSTAVPATATPTPRPAATNTPPPATLTPPAPTATP